ncbi:glutamine cyclotransferase [Luteibacter rhizovicinus]|uniref:Glutamine cyclotransferase n=1 Tax=Luteibacter rhizovicinus TaxID=242606 RepID=A0A4R3YKS0_9GAMM|nr:glutaminyl-peptide cyclotransferase [Luteibacter rhizovicinus]TCV91644.1 glutamine cyclotransferase [Luteibacter rhizovicinus]
MRGVSIGVAIFVAGCQSTAGRAPYQAPLLDYDVVGSYRHDVSSFTEGFFLANGVIYESTGLLGRSAVKKVDPVSGTPIASVAIPTDAFGEGMALLHHRLYQVSYKDSPVFVYDAESLAKIETLSLPGGGWGMTSDGTRLIMSDGSPRIRFFDERMRETGAMTVTDGEHPVEWLNELEWVHGDLFANVWPTNRIAWIDGQSGKVKGWVDISQLTSLVDASDADSVPNGIAYNKQHDTLLVTGKNWPNVYEIRLRKP